MCKPYQILATLLCAIALSSNLVYGKYFAFLPAYFAAACLHFVTFSGKLLIFFSLIINSKCERAHLRASCHSFCFYFDFCPFCTHFLFISRIKSMYKCAVCCCSSLSWQFFARCSPLIWRKIVRNVKVARVRETYLLYVYEYVCVSVVWNWNRSSSKEKNLFTFVFIGYLTLTTGLHIHCIRDWALFFFSSSARPYTNSDHKVRDEQKKLSFATIYFVSTHNIVLRHSSHMERKRRNFEFKIK